jgi:tRNA(fMet)-specific endonuclease VapC
LALTLAIDTNAYRAFTDGEPEFVEMIQRAKVVVFSVIVLGELRAGFCRGTRREENEQTLHRVLAIKRVRVSEITDATSNIYASVWSELRSKGVPIPINDLWIAAQCLENGLTLLTRDRHFENVAGLPLLP